MSQSSETTEWSYYVQNRIQIGYYCPYITNICIASNGILNQWIFDINKRGVTPSAHHKDHSAKAAAITSQNMQCFGAARLVVPSTKRSLISREYLTPDS